MHLNEWSALIGIFVTALTTWYATNSANRVKGRELAKDEQSTFLKTVVEELDKLKVEGAATRLELDKLRDEVRTLRSEKSLLERSNAEQLRVLARVAACGCAGCPNAARAAEFGGNV